MQSEIAAKIVGDREGPRRRIADIFGGQPAARAWARKVLRAARGLEAAHVADVRHLRKAEPRLTLKAAAYLAKDVANSR